MRDIQMVLERWGAWAASDSSGVDYSPIAAGFKGLLPYTSKTRQACSDSDALIIEGCLARLKQKKPDEHSLLVAHYLYRISKRKIAKVRGKWICPYISRHLLSLNPLQARCRRYSRGER